MNKRRILALVLACVLCVCIGIGGTLAWLTAQTTPVQNTFTTSDINITLAETDTGKDTDQNANTNSYQMVPGYTIAKDPKVTDVANSEKCYLFEKLEKSANFDRFMTYEMATGWNQLTGVDGVYYREVNTSTENQEFAVIANNTVTVKDTVTKGMMNAPDFTNPTLSVTAYASQYMKNNTESFTAAEAWANITTPTT